MMKGGGLLGKVAREWSKWFNSLALVATFIMLLVSFVDIVGGKVFRWPLPGSIDIIGVNLLLIGAFGIAQAEILKQHVRVDLLLVHLSERARAFLGIISATLCSAATAMLFYAVGLYAIRLYNTHLGSATLEFRFWPFTAILALGCLPLLLVFIWEIFDSLRGV